MTSRKLMYDTLEFSNKSNRAPRQIWALKWSRINYPEMVAKIAKDYPDDVTGAPGYWSKLPKTEGVSHLPGEYTDQWGCMYRNIHEGIQGEVREALVKEDDWSDYEKVHIPYELLTIDPDKINDFCKNSDMFIMGSVAARPFERLQKIRGSENLFVDLMTRPDDLFTFIKKMHQFYCEAYEVWAKTDIDGFMLMDDWGSQTDLLISPGLWREIFKPMYKDYVDIAHRYNKKILMHSDGQISKIFSDIIELGVDAINSQIFCVGLDEVQKYKGKITFWGEIDRQNLLPNASVKEINEAVKDVHSRLWDNGGCVAQCEFGPAAKPENVYEVFKTWDEITG